jgi:hypothetical protein
MRAFMIDAEHQTITKIDFVGDYRKIQQAIGCGRFTTGSRPLTGSIEEGFDTLCVSDDEFEEADDPKHWFQIDAERDPPSSYPIAGRGLVIGVDRDGETCGARINLKELTARVTFTRRKFRGYEITEVPDGLVVEQKAPRRALTTAAGTASRQKKGEFPPCAHSHS